MLGFTKTAVLGPTVRKKVIFSGSCFLDGSLSFSIVWRFNSSLLVLKVDPKSSMRLGLTKRVRVVLYTLENHTFPN